MNDYYRIPIEYAIMQDFNNPPQGKCEIMMYGWIRQWPISYDEYKFWMNNVLPFGRNIVCVPESWKV